MSTTYQKDDAPRGVDPLPYRRSRARTRFVCVVVVPLIATALAGCASPFTALVPGSTERASVAIPLTGLAAHATARVEGGVVPVHGTADGAGSMTLDVPLRPGDENDLTVTVSTPEKTVARTFTVRQTSPTGTGVLTGRAVDPSGQPIPGATARYGSASAAADGQGHFRLDGLPLGTVAAVVTAAGFSPAVAYGQLSGTAPTAARDATLADLPPARAVGPAGAVLDGDGWKVSVPPGALTGDRQVRVGALPLTGLIDDLGQPVLQVMPADLRFLKPISVTFEPHLLGEVFDAGSIVANDAASLRPMAVAASRQGDGGFSISLSGAAQLRIVPPPEHVLDEIVCTPYAANDDPAGALRAARRSVSALTASMPEAWRLYDQYLTPGSPTAVRTEVGDSWTIDEFSNASETIEARQAMFRRLVAAVRARPPALQAPGSPASGALGAFGLGVADIEWTDWTSIPGLIAGGVGDVTIPNLGNFADVRTFTGQYVIVPAIDDHSPRRGVLKTVELKAQNWYLDVKDSIDFCPGALGGWSGVLAGETATMSRLERTPHPSGGTYAKAILWHGFFPLVTEDEVADVTDQYDNDPDKDEWPDSQPWEGAGFTLDNCPGESNADQADSDKDGKGDACEERTAEVEWRLDYTAVEHLDAANTSINLHTIRDARTTASYSGTAQIRVDSDADVTKIDAMSTRTTYSFDEHVARRDIDPQYGDCRSDQYTHHEIVNPDQHVDAVEQILRVRLTGSGGATHVIHYPLLDDPRMWARHVAYRSSGICHNWQPPFREYHEENSYDTQWFGDDYWRASTRQKYRVPGTLVWDDAARAYLLRAHVEGMDEDLGTTYTIDMAMTIRFNNAGP